MKILLKLILFVVLEYSWKENDLVDVQTLYRYDGCRFHSDNIWQSVSLQ